MNDPISPRLARDPTHHHCTSLYLLQDKELESCLKAIACPSGPTSRNRPLCSSSGWTRPRGRWAGSLSGQHWRRPRLSSTSYGVWCEVFDVCERVITKLCDECLYWLIYMHQLMHVNLLYQCLRLSCPCVCVAECHLWLEITYLQQTM